VQKISLCNSATLQPCTFATMLRSYTAWLLLSAFTAYTAWQLHLALIYVLTLVIQNPDLRPVGWNTGTVGLWSRLSIFILGGLWLITILFMEQGLSTSLKEKRLMTQIGRYIATIGIICAICYGLLNVSR